MENNLNYEEVEVNSERWLDLIPLLNEQFKDIKGYEGLYQVSNYGRIKSLPKIVNTKLKNVSSRKTKEKILKCNLTRDNYLSVNLVKNKKNKTIRVHQLVCNTFIENEENYKCINHKDSNPRNNKIDNLEWCTQSYNIKYAYKKGNAKPTRTRCVVQMDKNYKIMNVFNSINDACRHIGKKGHQNIIKCCQNKIPTAYGYRWKYYE